MNAEIRDIIDAYRRHPGALIGWALVVFLPLTGVRWALIAGDLPAVAIGVTVAGHLVLAAVLAARVDVGAPRCGPVALVALLVGIVALEIVSGLPIDQLLGLTDLAFAIGGFVPSVVLGPAFALLLARRVSSGRRRRREDDRGSRRSAR